MSLEPLVLRLGLAGFSGEQQEKLAHSLAQTSSPAGMSWTLGTFADSDAWWINGARTQLLGGETVRVASGVPAGRSTQLSLPEIDRPVAFALPLAPRHFEPACSFDPQSPASVDAVLDRFEHWLRPMVAQFCLASQILEQESALGSGIYHVSANGVLLAVVNLRGDVGVLPTADPLAFEEAMWSHQTSHAMLIPEGFVRTSLAQLMWQYALRTSRDVLPARYRTGLLYFRRPPRLPQRLLKDVHLLLMRELACAPAGFDALQRRTGLAAGQLSHALAALYLVGTITSNPKRAGLIAGRRAEAADSADSGHGLSNSIIPSSLEAGAAAALVRRPVASSDMTAPAPMSLE